MEDLNRRITIVFSRRRGDGWTTPPRDILAMAGDLLTGGRRDYPQALSYVMARLVSAIHDLRVDPADVVDATLRRHDVDHAAAKHRLHRDGLLHAAVGQVNLPVTASRQISIVGNEKQRSAGALSQRKEQVDHDLPGRVVEVAGRFIGQ